MKMGTTKANQETTCARNAGGNRPFNRGELRWIYFVSTEEDCYLKGIYFAISRSGKNHSLY